MWDASDTRQTFGLPPGCVGNRRKEKAYDVRDFEKSAIVRQLLLSCFGGFLFLQRSVPTKK